MAKFCTNCGKELTKSATHCGECGEKVAKTTSSKKTTETKTQTTTTNSKSKIAAGILGILVGTFGVHNFYLGFTGKAVAQLLITVLSCGFLSVISWIWGLVEGIMVLTGSIDADAEGNPLVD